MPNSLTPIEALRKIRELAAAFQPVDVPTRQLGLICEVADGVLLAPQNQPSAADRCLEIIEKTQGSVEQLVQAIGVLALEVGFQEHKKDERP